MTWTAVALLLLGAVVHAWWNLIGKRGSPSAVFFLVASIAGMVCLSPMLMLRAQMLPQIPWQVWLLLAVTGVFQAIYYVGLARAYRAGHISIAYPLARASPVVLIALVNVCIGRGREIGSLAGVGMALIGVGCLFLPMRRFREIRLKNYVHTSTVMALVAAIGTVGYTITDSEALKILRGLLGSAPTDVGIAQVALLYLMLEMAFSAAVLALYVGVNKSERRELAAQNTSSLKAAAAAGAMIVTAYGLALMAMAYVSNVSYVAAFRQISIPIGVALGIFLLKEPCPPPKIAAVALLLTGLAMVAVG